VRAFGQRLGEKVSHPSPVDVEDLEFGHACLGEGKGDVCSRIEGIRRVLNRPGIPGDSIT
jgi:hypothetical protein